MRFNREEKRWGGPHLAPQDLSVACRFHPGHPGRAAGGPGLPETRTGPQCLQDHPGRHMKTCKSSSSSLDSFPGSLPPMEGLVLLDPQARARASFLGKASQGTFIDAGNLSRLRNSMAAEVQGRAGGRGPELWGVGSAARPQAGAGPGSLVQEARGAGVPPPACGGRSAHERGQESQSPRPPGTLPPQGTTQGSAQQLSS